MPTIIPHASRPVVAVLDDDPANCHLIKWSLQEMANVCIFYTSDELFSFLKTSVPDVVFLDLMMPEKNGLIVLKQLRRAHPQAFLRVVLLSASHTGQLAQQIKSEFKLTTHSRPYMRNEFEKLVRDMVAKNI